MRNKEKYDHVHSSDGQCHIWRLLGLEECLWLSANHLRMMIKFLWLIPTHVTEV